jgi:hypothetical protein
MKKFLKKTWWVIPLVLLIVFSGFVIWAETPPAPMPEAIAALEPDQKVQVTTDPWLVFKPLEAPATTGLIFYPGGRVDPRSYAPLARNLAEPGYLTVIVPMPLNLAVTSPGKATEVMAAFPEIQTWGIAGHSLGGAMGVNFIKNHPGKAQGLALLAAYPAENDDLSNQELPVLSIFATQDGLSTREKIDASRALLPTDTEFAAIDGGNHAQFGWYGDQPGDNPATITRQEQQEQTIALLARWLSSLAGRQP